MEHAGWGTARWPARPSSSLDWPGPSWRGWSSTPATHRRWTGPPGQGREHQPADHDDGRGQVQQVLAELLGDVPEHTSPRTPVAGPARPVRRRVVPAKMTDSGPGISQQDTAQAFNQYHRGTDRAGAGPDGSPGQRGRSRQAASACPSYRPSQPRTTIRPCSMILAGPGRPGSGLAARPAPRVTPHPQDAPRDARASHTDRQRQPTDERGYQEPEGGPAQSQPRTRAGHSRNQRSTDATPPARRPAPQLGHIRHHVVRRPMKPRPG